MLFEPVSIVGAIVTLARCKQDIAIVLFEAVEISLLAVTLFTVTVFYSTSDKNCAAPSVHSGLLP